MAQVAGEMVLVGAAKGPAAVVTAEGATEDRVAGVAAGALRADHDSQESVGAKVVEVVTVLVEVVTVQVEVVRA